MTMTTSFADWPRIYPGEESGICELALDIAILAAAMDLESEIPDYIVEMYLRDLPDIDLDLDY